MNHQNETLYVVQLVHANKKNLTLRKPVSLIFVCMEKFKGALAF